METQVGALLAAHLLAGIGVGCDCNSRGWEVGCGLGCLCNHTPLLCRRRPVGQQHLGATLTCGIGTCLLTRPPRKRVHSQA